MFTKIKSPDRATHAAVGRVLSVSGTSVVASNTSSLTYTINSRPSKELLDRLQEMGAEVGGA